MSIDLSDGPLTDGAKGSQVRLPTDWTRSLEELVLLFNAVGIQVASLDLARQAVLQHLVHFASPSVEIETTARLEDRLMCADYSLLHSIDTVVSRGVKSDVASVGGDRMCAEPSLIDHCQRLQLVTKNDGLVHVVTLFRGHLDQPFSARDERQLKSYTPLLRSALVFRLQTMELAAKLDGSALVQSVPLPLGWLRASTGKLELNQAAIGEFVADDAVISALEDEIQRERHPCESQNAVEWSLSQSLSERLGVKRVKLSLLNSVNDGYLLEFSGHTFKQNARNSAVTQFSQDHALSPAEASILELLVDGLSVEHIAIRRSARSTTIQTQFRSIREKTGYHSQSELVRVVKQYRYRLTS